LGDPISEIDKHEKCCGAAGLDMRNLIGIFGHQLPSTLSGHFMLHDLSGRF
jgi:hypothetical protein